MLRISAIALISLAITAGLSGCASNSNEASGSINYVNQQYENIRFDKPDLPASAQAASFKVDIDACAAQAEQSYQESVVNSAKLAQIYNRPISPETLQGMRRLQVQTCMTGQTGSKGKGWVAR